MGFMRSKAPARDLAGEERRAKAEAERRAKEAERKKQEERDKVLSRENARKRFRSQLSAQSGEQGDAPVGRKTLLGE